MTLEERIREVLAELRRSESRAYKKWRETHSPYQDGMSDAFEEAADLVEAALAEANPDEQTQEKVSNDDEGLHTC